MASKSCGKVLIFSVGAHFVFAVRIWLTYYCSWESSNRRFFCRAKLRTLWLVWSCQTPSLQAVLRQCRLWRLVVSAVLFHKSSNENSRRHEYSVLFECGQSLIFYVTSDRRFWRKAPSCTTLLSSIWAPRGTGVLRSVVEYAFEDAKSSFRAGPESVLKKYYAGK